MSQILHNPTEFPKKLDAKISIPGPAGLIEAMTTTPKHSGRGHHLVVICHPHPQHGGTMNNKVVHTLSRAYHSQGLRTIRFNFRGVGKSQGKFSEYHGEIDDLLAVIAWAEQVQPEHELWLAGFSFGAYIASFVAHNEALVKHLLTVSPAVHHKDYTPFNDNDLPWLVIQGTQDDVVPAAEVSQFAHSRGPLTQLVCLEGAGHFFHGRLLELRDIVERGIDIELNKSLTQT